MSDDSEIAWEKLLDALDIYSGILKNSAHLQNGYREKIGESSAEDKFKLCSEAVNASIETIIKCLRIDPDYISDKASFLNIVKWLIFLFTKEKKVLNNILPEENLIKLSEKAENIVCYYVNDLNETEKAAFRILHSDLLESLSKLRGILIVYNRLDSSIEETGAKEALQKWSKSDPSFKNSIVDEWETIA